MFASPMDVDKWLCRAGIMSRTDAIAAVAAGRVRIDGELAASPRAVVHSSALVTVDGAAASVVKRVALAMHKPPGIMTTRRDLRGRKTVFDLLPQGLPWLAPIGRLDLDSEGLLLFTNDPHLGWALSDPSRGVDKTYLVTCKGTVSDESVQHLRRGVLLAGQSAPTLPALITVRERTERTTTLEIILHEGKKRQIRRMILAVGSRVRRLVRTKIGPFELGSLPMGECRELCEPEIGALAVAAGFHLYERSQRPSA